MEPFGSEGYWLVRILFERGLAVIYLLAFIVALYQFRPLAGEDGLLPLDEYAEGVEFRERPSLFHLVPDDRTIGTAAGAGIAFSVLALVGVPYWLPEPYPIAASMVLWGLMWVLYLSFVNAGRVFYGYGWESMLLETGFLAIFLGAGETAPPTVVLLLISWVLFRNMFGAGLIKIRGDDCWRELTCMDYHYETQPMPNPLSWFAHRLPDQFHRIEVLGNHIVELAIPFLYFAPQPYATIGGLATISFQLWLMTTGNFAWLNALTIVQATVTFSDNTLTTLPGVSAPAAAPTPLYLEVLALLVAVVVIALSIPPARNMLSPGQVMNTSFDPIHLVNSYGAFGSITRDRFQLVIEGTRKSDPDDDDWEEYGFEGQPVDPADRPPQWAPYHLRLDWQLWFAAMRRRPGPRQRWLFSLLTRLLEGNRETESLLAGMPFEEPPQRIRVLRYRYQFTTREERAETGRWWSRERVGTYVPSSTREDLDQWRPAAIGKRQK